MPLASGAKEVRGQEISASSACLPLLSLRIRCGICLVNLLISTNSLSPQTENQQLPPGIQLSRDAAQPEQT